jgi:hypothetical protein
MISNAKRRKRTTITSKIHHYCQWILHLSEASSLTPLLQEMACNSRIDVDNLDGDASLMHSCLSITSSAETFSHLHKLNLEEPLPSDLLALTCSNWIVSVGKALDDDTILIMSDRWRKAFEEAEIGDIAGVKVSKQRQITPSFNPDQPWSHFSNPSRQNVSDHAECVFILS